MVLKENGDNSWKCLIELSQIIYLIFFELLVLIIHFLHRKHMDFTYKVINDYIMRK
jgi:phosphate starvation-inducible membrane PsiE